MTRICENRHAQLLYLCHFGRALRGLSRDLGRFERKLHGEIG